MCRCRRQCSLIDVCLFSKLLVFSLCLLILIVDLGLFTHTHIRRLERCMCNGRKKKFRFVFIRQACYEYLFASGELRRTTESSIDTRCVLMRVCDKNKSFWVSLLIVNDYFNMHKMKMSIGRRKGERENVNRWTHV
jgi:hypothetical protein